MKTSHKLSVGVVAGAAFALVALWSSQARAELPQKTFRLHLDTGLMEIQRGEIDWDESNRDTDLDHTAAGLGIPRAGAGLGFVVWRGLVIGGRIETAFYDDDGEYPAGTWIRSPHGSEHAPFTRDEGALVYVKVGHLPG